LNIYNLTKPRRHLQQDQGITETGTSAVGPKLATLTLVGLGHIGVRRVFTESRVVLVAALAPLSYLRLGQRGLRGLTPERIGIRIIKNKGQRTRLD
jgi:hypothetical protein